MLSSGLHFNFLNQFNFHSTTQSYLMTGIMVSHVLSFKLCCISAKELRLITSFRLKTCFQNRLQIEIDILECSSGQYEQGLNRN